MQVVLSALHNSKALKLAEERYGLDNSCWLYLQDNNLALGSVESELSFLPGSPTMTSTPRLGMTRGLPSLRRTSLSPKTVEMTRSEVHFPDTVMEPDPAACAAILYLLNFIPLRLITF